MAKKRLFEKTPANISFMNCHKVIYGIPKAGKTTLSAHQIVGERHPFFIATEDGHKSMDVYKERVSNWNEFCLLAEKIIKNKDQMRAEHSCLVFDLTTDLDLWSMNHIEERLQVNDVTDLDWGKGWRLSTKAFRKPVDHLLNVLPCTFLALAKEATIKKDGEEYIQIKPDLSKGVYNYLNGKVDAIINVDPNDMMIRMSPTKSLVAGCRYPELKKNFKLLENDPRGSLATLDTAFAKAN